MPTYCLLSDAYGGLWGTKTYNNNSKNIKTTGSVQSTAKPNPYPQVDPSTTLTPSLKMNPQKSQKPQTPPTEPINNDSFKNQSFPSCQQCPHCLDQNNAFQQNVVNDALYRHPRWYPQPQFPYNRIESFGNMNYNNRPGIIEHFTQMTRVNAKSLLNMVFQLLIILFIIQSIEILIRACMSKKK